MKRLRHYVIAAFALLSLAMMQVSAADVREILLLEGPVEADWSDKNSVDPMRLAGVAAGDEIHVYTSNIRNGATCFIRTKTNGWPAISKEFDVAPVKGDISCVITQTILDVIKDQTLMFGGSAIKSRRFNRSRPQPPKPENKSRFKPVIFTSKSWKRTIINTSKILLMI